MVTISVEIQFIICSPAFYDGAGWPACEKEHHFYADVDRSYVQQRLAWYS